MEKTDFGTTLRGLRQEKNLSQAKLGQLIGVTGKAISKWENNYTKPKGASLVRMSEVFGVSVMDMIRML